MGLTKAWFLNSATGCFKPSKKTRRTDNVRWRKSTRRCRMLWMIQCVNDLKCVSSSCPCRSFSVCWKSIMSRWCLEQIRFSGYDTCYDAIMFPDSSFSSPLCPGGWLAVSGVSDSGRAQSQRGAATRFLCGGSPHSPLRDCSSGREMNGKRIQTKPINCSSQRLRLQSCAVNIRIFRELNALWSSSKRASRSSPAWICWTRLAVSISIHQSQKLTELKTIRPSVWAPPHWAMSKHTKGHAAV